MIVYHCQHWSRNTVWLYIYIYINNLQRSSSDLEKYWGELYAHVYYYFSYIITTSYIVYIVQTRQQLLLVCSLPVPSRWRGWHQLSRRVCSWHCSPPPPGRWARSHHAAAPRTWLTKFWNFNTFSSIIRYPPFPPLARAPTNNLNLHIKT